MLHLRTRAYASISDEPVAEPARSRSAWLEPQTLAIGAMVLAFTLAEGSANDWLALGWSTGITPPTGVGRARLRTVRRRDDHGRFLGPIVLDRFGRLRSLLGSALAATVGVLLVVWSGRGVVAVVGIPAVGFGSALGFPVGMTPPRTTRCAPPAGSASSPRWATAPSSAAHPSWASSATMSAPSTRCWSWRSRWCPPRCWSPQYDAHCPVGAVIT